MENYSIVIFILFSMVALSSIADKIKLPYPILLVVAGIAIGFLPMSHIALDPEIVFLIFLPPMLYDAAFNISFKDFRVNLSTIGTMSVSLVFLTATGIAAVAHYLIPGMTWPLAFVLGSILSATDAVAAIGITKGLRITHKTSTILEGESLINDASALVAYRFALAAVTGTAFVFWKALLEFLLLMGGGFAVGLVLGRLTAFILKRIHPNHLVTISFMLLMPFVAYLAAEELHVSGVIAVVILGLSISRFSSKVFQPALKQQSRSIWEIIVFLLNGLIFILIGLQLPYVVNDLPEGQWLPYTGYAFIIVLITLLLRTSVVFMQRLNLKRAFRSQRGRVTEQALLDFKTSFIISWAGMKGIVSLATAIALPLSLSDGHAFPQRNAIVFISVLVVLITIVGQGLTLPLLVKALKVEVEKEPE